MKSSVKGLKESGRCEIEAWIWNLRWRLRNTLQSV